MHILYLTPYVPSQVRVRPYQLIRHLAMLGHEVTLICLAVQNEEPQALEDMRRYCHEVVVIPTSGRQAALQALRALPSTVPLQASYGASEALVRAARHRADRHDVVHIEHLRGSSYGAPLRDYPLVLDAVDCISLLFERTLRQSASVGGRIKAFIDLARTRQAEGGYSELFDQVVVTSAEDRWALLQIQPPHTRTAQIEVVPNGVDLERFTPALQTTREPATLVLSGKMSYHANTTAALWLGRTIMPLIWRERRDVRCLIVGRDPPQAVRTLANDPRIIVTGDVPSVVPFLQRATLAVAPLRYSVGIQNKVIEAMATATPVVTTPPAVRALGARPGQDLIVAATAQEFADATLELLELPERRAAIGWAGRRYVEQYHDWPSSAVMLSQAYIAAQGSRPDPDIFLETSSLSITLPDVVHPL